MNATDTVKAREDIDDVAAVSATVRRAFAYGGADVILMVWGGIWFVGFLGTDLFARNVIPAGTFLTAGALWLVLVLAGMAFSLYWGIRYGRVFPNPHGARIGWFWFFLYVYVWLAYPLLLPFLNVDAVSSAEGARHYAALATLVPMFAYVVMGLFLERYMLWIGLAVTALLFLGLYGLSHFFWLWMAFLGGAALFVPGLVMRRRSGCRPKVLSAEVASRA